MENISSTNVILDATIESQTFSLFFCEYEIEDLRNYKDQLRFYNQTKKNRMLRKRNRNLFFTIGKHMTCIILKNHAAWKLCTTKHPPYSLHCLKNMQRISGILCVTPGLHNIEHTKIISCNRSFKPFPMSVQ